MQEFQLLRRQFCIEEVDTSEVGARTGETRDETEPHGIVGDDEDERDRRDWRFCSKYGGSTSAGEYHGDVPANELRSQFRHPIELIFRPAHVAGFCEALAKSAQTLRNGVRRGDAEEPNHRHGRLLRVRRERPRCRAAEQGGAVAAFELSAHSITSSARASSVGGISRPSALALLRLITSSNFVGCSTGSSAGLAPLRILSTNVAARWKCPTWSAE